MGTLDPTAPRRRVRRGLVVALGAASVLTLAAGPAGAGPIHDRNPDSGRALAIQIGTLDSASVMATAALPDAQAAAAFAAGALDTARAAEQQALLSTVAPIDPASGRVVDNAAAAVLGDLAPERARAGRVAAEAAVAAANAKVTELQTTILNSANQRSQLLAQLAADGQDRTVWSIGLLDRLGDPITAGNIAGLSAWIGAESNDGHLRNPLATTMGAPGATIANSAGVKGYPSDAVGLDATVQTLHNGLYPGIIDALHQGDSALTVVLAVAGSPWGTGENAVARLAMDQPR